MPIEQRLEPCASAWLRIRTRCGTPTRRFPDARHTIQPCIRNASSLSKSKEASAKQAISLLEELFPKESRRRAPARPGTRRPERLESPHSRRIPRVALDAAHVPVQATSTRPPQETYKNVQKRLDGLADADSTPCALVLRTAGKHLTPEDFRRVLPSAQHIAGWVSAGNFARVIKRRNRRTLAPNGEYLVLFGREDDAVRFREHAMELHAHARAVAPRPGRSSTVPAGPHIPGDGGAPYGRLESYSLTPPSLDLDLRILRPPYNPFVHDIVAHGGYPQIVRGRRSAHEVLLEVETTEPQFKMMEWAIFRDGEARGLHWSTVGLNRGLREIRIPLQGLLDLKDGGEVEDDSAEVERWTTRAMRKWIVSFTAEDEAKRFVMNWHRRDIRDLLPAEWLDEDAAPIVNAEYIW